MLEPMSGLFWWSAETTSTLTFGFLAVKSAMASLAAATDPGPPISEYKLDMSLSTPILILTWPYAAPVVNRAAKAVIPISRFIASSSWFFEGQSALNAQVFVQLAEISLELGIGELI